MSERTYDAEQSDFAKGVLSYMQDEPVFPGLSCGTILESLDHLGLLWRTIEKVPHGFPQEDLVRALTSIKERDARRGDDPHEVNFGLPFLALLERDRQSTGASHSRILEAYHLLFLIAEEHQNAQRASLAAGKA